MILVQKTFNETRFVLCDWLIDMQLDIDQTRNVSFFFSFFLSLPKISSQPINLIGCLRKPWIPQLIRQRSVAGFRVESCGR
jgi:hypothetical protein